MSPDTLPTDISPENMADQEVAGRLSPPIDPALTYLHNWLSKHLVCLAAVYFKLDQDGEPTGEQDVYAYTSFLYVQGNDCFLITAGHILEQIAQYKKYPKGSINVYLVALSNAEVSGIHPIRFDHYDEAPKIYIDNEADGLDYGWVYLRPYYRNLLLEDQIRPIGDTDWASLNGRSFDGQVLVGFPADLMSPTTSDSKTLARTIEPVIMSVNALDPPPSDIQATTFPRYIGQITHRADIRVTGMSGGPILAFGGDTCGGWRYWVQAIQSSKNKANTLVFGCPADVFVPRMLEEIKEARATQPDRFIRESE